MMEYWKKQQQQRNETKAIIEKFNKLEIKDTKVLELLEELKEVWSTTRSSKSILPLLFGVDSMETLVVGTKTTLVDMMARYTTTLGEGELKTPNLKYYQDKGHKIELDGKGTIVYKGYTPKE